MITQLDQVIEKKHKGVENKNRTIRKLAEKTLKALRVNIESFALDVVMLIASWESPKRQWWTISSRK
jgi:hypothetical protein